MSYSEIRHKRVLAIGAHPDDVLLGAAGYLLRLKESGYQVTLLTLTSGALGGGKAEREAEEIAASRLCGFDLMFGHLPDGNINHSTAIDVIARAMAGLHPDMVLTHSGEDDHQDHTNTHDATMAASRFIPNIVTYESPTSRFFMPTMTVDCTGVWERKIAALRCHHSQMSRRPYLEWTRIIAQYRSWPRNVGAFCEAFKVDRQDSHSFPTLLAGDPLALTEVTHVDMRPLVYA